MKECPCRDCQNHNEDCHVWCERYTDWNAKKKALREEILEKKLREMRYWDRKKEAIHRMARKTRKK